MSFPREDEDQIEAADLIAGVNVVEAQTVGGGRRYEVTGLDGVRVTVVVHHTGEREVILLTEDDDEPVLTLTFTSAQACTLAAALADTLHDRTEASPP
jgi:K+/H+ antiporter YhaU regulatory subunit KhtT